MCSWTFFQHHVQDVSVQNIHVSHTCASVPQKTLQENTDINKAKGI